MSAQAAVGDASVSVDVTAGALESPRLLRRLLRRPVAVICVVYLLALVGVAIVAPILLPGVTHQYAGDLFATRQGPSLHHLLGTDSLGRDVLDRLLVGTRPTLVGVAEGIVVFLALGVPLGLAAGFFGGWIDQVVNWLADLTFSMPAAIIILVVLSVFPGSALAGMATFGALSAPSLMRVIRSATLPVREELYVAAARVSGLSRSYIVRRHVLPRIAGVVIVQTSFACAVALLVESGLAFLNLFGNPATPSWGGMIADGVGVILLQPWLIWPPGLVMALTIIALALLGSSVRDATAETWSGSARASGRRRRRTSAGGGVTDERRSSGEAALLSVEDLSVTFSSHAGTVTVVENVSFDVRLGETLGVVGESGCGKTITAKAVLGLLPGNGTIEGGRILFGGRDLAALSQRELRKVRGKEIALVSQEPMVSLNPSFRIGWQLAEAIHYHQKVSSKVACERAVELLRRVHLPEPEAVARRYPHELSGGMAQRVAIARALAGEPKLLIADEPTTALDVTVQAEILDLLRELQADREMAILLVTHDWGVIADICDRVVVMYAGQVVERAEIGPVFREPLHPYTEALLASSPQIAPEAELLPAIPGAVPQPGAWRAGCHFHPRCGYASSRCGEAAIPLQRPSPGRETRCIHYERLLGVSE